jgi:hypothetical protein
MPRSKKTPNKANKKPTRVSAKKLATKKKPARKVGRPSKYDKIDLAQVQRIAELHMTDKEISYALGISPQTLDTYKKKYPKFLESLKKGKAVTDQKVVLSLFQRATGYTAPDVHISTYEGKVTKTAILKHHPPDPTACIFWLKNRQPEQWRDRVAVEGDPKRPLSIKIEWTK